MYGEEARRSCGVGVVIGHVVLCACCSGRSATHRGDGRKFVAWKLLKIKVLDSPMNIFKDIEQASFASALLWFRVTLPRGTSPKKEAPSTFARSSINMESFAMKNFRTRACQRALS
jgi:hypothetical protein